MAEPNLRVAQVYRLLAIVVTPSGFAAVGHAAGGDIEAIGAGADQAAMAVVAEGKIRLRHRPMCGTGEKRHYVGYLARWMAIGMTAPCRATDFGDPSQEIGTVALLALGWIVQV